MLRGILLHNGIVERFQWSWETTGSRKLLAPLKRTSVMLSSVRVSREKGITRAIQGNMVVWRGGGCGQPEGVGEWVASSPLARARWSEAMVVGYPSLIRTKQVEAVQQYASHLFLAPDLIGLLMDLNVPKVGFRHMMEYMSRRGSAYSAATGLPFPRPIPTREAFTDTWKELVTPLDLRPPVSVPDPPASGRSWPLP